MGKEVSLSELDKAIEGAETLESLRDNLTNLQNRHGNHKQLFVENSRGNETEIRHIKRELNEIIDSLKSDSKDYSIHAFEPRLSSLPTQVEDKARDILKEQF